MSSEALDVFGVGQCSIDYLGRIAEYPSVRQQLLDEDGYLSVDRLDELTGCRAEGIHTAIDLLPRFAQL